MDFTNQDASCYLPLNRSGNIFEINHRYKRTDCQTFILFLFLVAASLLCNKKSCHSVLGSFLKLWLCATLSLIILPIVFVLLFVFAIYRQLIIIIQKIKLGSNYGGILLGPDAIWTIEDSCAKSIINVLIVVQSDECGLKFYERTEEQIRNAFFINSNEFVKLLATYKKCCGYSFLTKNTVNPCDCIKPLNIEGKAEITKQDLMILLSKISNSTLPKNHSTFWEVLIGTQNVQWNSSNQNFYPIVFRIHHALGDGAGLLKVLLNTLVEQIPNNSTLNKPIHKQSRGHVINDYIKKLLVLFQMPLAILKQGVRRKCDNNILHGPELCGEKILVLATENQNCCISSIKEIKDMVKGIKFADVLFTAVSTSIQEYFSKNSEVIPETITSVIPVFSSHNLKNFDNELEAIQNSFSIALLDIPIIQKNNTLNTMECIKALKMMNKETTSLNCAVDYQVNYWILNVVSKYLPEPLLRPLIESSQSTLVISNLPGPTHISLFKEYDVEDIVFWIPHRGTTGLGISILSYDNRLQIGLNVDRALISKTEDAQSIVDSILEEIVKMGHAINGVV